jgi:hypothetical protein
LLVDATLAHAQLTGNSDYPPILKLASAAMLTMSLSLAPSDDLLRLLASALDPGECNNLAPNCPLR